MLECDPDETFTTEELAELYYLILKKQHGQATKADIARLISLANRYLCTGRNTIEAYLACHGYYKMEDMLRCWFEKGYSEFGSWFLEDLAKASQDAMHDAQDEGYDALGVEVWVVPAVDVYITLEDLLLHGFRPIYEAYHRFITSADFAQKMVRTLNRIERYFAFPTMHSLSDLILLVDELTDLYHNSGKLMESYADIDTETAKELAERWFERGGMQ